MPSAEPPPLRSAAEPGDWREPPQLRTLRRMVAVLTATLIIGVLTIAATLVIRIAMEGSRDAAPAAITAEEIPLPEGEEITAVGATPNALSVATRDAAGTERIRVYHPESGEELSATEVRRR